MGKGKRQPSINPVQRKSSSFLHNLILVLEAPPFLEGLRLEAKNQTPSSLPSPYSQTLSTNTLYSLQEAQTVGLYFVLLGFPDGSAGKESTCNAGDLGWIPGLGRSPGGGNGYPLQYSGLENSMNCMVHGVAKSQTPLSQTPLSDFHFHFSLCLIEPIAFLSILPMSSSTYYYFSFGLFPWPLKWTLSFISWSSSICSFCQNNLSEMKV